MRHPLDMSAPAQHHEGYEVLASRTSSKPGFRKKTWLLRGIGLCVLVGAIIATSFTLGRKDNLHKVMRWIHENTAAGLVIFGLLYIWFTVMFLPPALLAACAGALYGFLLAIPIVWFFAIVGETVSFLLGRFLLRKWVRELTADWPMWAALNAALREDGWKLVLLLRMSPAIPFGVVNYALGSSSLSFGHYFWPSVVGIMPSLIIYVWLGSLAADVTEAVAGGGVSTPPAAKIAIIVVCAVSALIVVVLSAVYTKRAIDKRLASVHIEEEVQVEEQHQHYLLGSGSQSGDGDTDEELGARSGPPAVAAAGGEDGLHSSGSGVRRGVLVSVETPMLVVHRTSINGGSSRAKQQPQQQQQQQQQLRTVAVDSRQPGWGARVTQKLGFGAGSSVTAKPRKLKVSEDLGGDSFVVPRHGDPHGVGGDGGSASSSSSNRVNRDMH